MKKGYRGKKGKITRTLIFFGHAFDATAEVVPRVVNDP
jgi:hypothetical protein